MNYLSVDKLSKSYGERVLFENISFGLFQGQRLAIVGVNGCGKSTLMKILVGKETPDKGSFSFRSGMNVSFLPQNPEFDEKSTAFDAIFFSDNEHLRIIRDYEWLSRKDELTEKESDEIQELIGKIDHFQLWDYESQVKQILGQLGIDDDQKRVAEMSGGQRKRVALARELISRPDFIILDEPTNHLDVETIEWLEKYISQNNLTLLMVTHDRYFLDSVCTGILEMDNKQIYRYEGNYASFLEQKSERETIQSIEVDKAKNLMRKELEWMRRQPKARGTKSKSRIDAFYETKDKASQNLKKEKVEMEVKGRRLGGKILELENVSKSFDGKTVLDNFSYVFRKNDRIGIVGKNGAGKSTFLNMITGQLAADSGKIDVGQNTVYGYYQQSDLVFDETQKVIDKVLSVAEHFTLADGSVITASQFLNKFLFLPKQQHDFIRKLSGGERRRLQLLLVLIKNPNFLILDEPTNDLDIVTLNVLEEFLDNFAGCLILVSHDRYFMDKLVEHLFIFEGAGKVKDFNGNYTDYRQLAKERKDELANQKGKKPTPAAAPKEKEVKQKLNYHEQREFEDLPKKIEKLQKQLANLDALMLKGEGSHEDFATWGKEIAACKSQMDELELRWLELSERG